MNNDELLLNLIHAKNWQGIQNLFEHPDYSACVLKAIENDAPVEVVELFMNSGCMASTVELFDAACRKDRLDIVQLLDGFRELSNWSCSFTIPTTACDVLYWLIDQPNNRLDMGELLVSVTSTLKPHPKKCKLVEKLLDKGVDVNYETKQGFSALWWALLYSDAKMVKLLLDRGADANTPNIQQVKERVIFNMDARHDVKGLLRGEVAKRQKL